VAVLQLLIGAFGQAADGLQVLSRNQGSSKCGDADGDQLHTPNSMCLVGAEFPSVWTKPSTVIAKH
jgi:hypothetical protein